MNNMPDSQLSPEDGATLTALLKAHEGPSYFLTNDDFMCCCGTRLTKTESVFMVGVTEAWRAHLADVIEREYVAPRVLPNPNGGCVCTPFSQSAGGGYVEHLAEYEPACPAHSEHLYDPRTGVWVLRDSRDGGPSNG